MKNFLGYIYPSLFFIICFFITSCGGGKTCPDYYYLNSGLSLQLSFYSKITQKSLSSGYAGYTSFYETQTRKEFPLDTSSYWNQIRIPLNISSSTTQVILKGYKGNATLIISGYNPRVEYYDRICEFQLKIDEPIIQYFSLDYKINSFNINSLTLNVDVFI